MSSRLSRKQFKAVQNEWYAKAREAGFQDIEYGDGSLKAAHPRGYNSIEAVQREAKQEYYHMCERWLYEGTFESERHRLIFEYHAGGISIRSILKLLNDAGVEITRDMIHRNLRKMISAMKAKYLVK